MAKIRVIARARARAGKAEELKAVLRQLVAPTRQEQGCNYYEFFQSQLEGVFVFNEEWERAEDLQAHASTERFKAVIAQAEPLLAEPMEVNLLTAAA
jgi:quinol monooxygenase YgiN